MIIIDENVEQYWIELLEKNYEVLSISKQYPQLADIKIIELAKLHKGILITEDKDFGELVFAHGIKGQTIIFLRYDQPNYYLIESKLLLAVSKYYNNPDHHFIITKKQCEGKAVIDAPLILEVQQSPQQTTSLQFNLYQCATTKPSKNS